MPDQVNTIKTDAGVEVYENAICDYLQQYIDERGIEDMSKEPQSKWNAAFHLLCGSLLISSISCESIY